MGWVVLGRCAGGGGRLSSILSLSLTSLASSLIFTILCILTLALTLASLVRAENNIFEEGKSDKEILDDLLQTARYDKRLLPPVQGLLGVTDADFCCGMQWPGDTTGLANRSSTFSNDPKNQNKNQNNIHYTPHQHLRTHLRGTLTVNVSVLLLSLASPDESSLKYEVEFLLQQQWFDPRLRYSNRSRYEFLNAIHHYDKIWLPDTYFIMHGDFKDPLIPVHFALRIYRNGTVNYLMRRHLILSCQGRLNIFPFDDPLCSFAIESISYEQTAITYVWKNDEGTLRKSPSLTSLNAYLIKNQTITCPIKVSWRAEGQFIDYEDEFDEFGDSKCSLCQRRFEEQGNYSCLKVDLIFTRDRAFYFTTVFIPGIILVTSSFITFWLEWNAVPARVMIGVTTMLNFFTTSNGFRGTLPVVSNLTAMNVWDGVCMCFIYASLLEFVCVNYVGRKRPMHNVVYRPGENPVTQRLPAVLSRIGIILASPLKREGGPPTGGGTGPNEIVTCTNCGPNPCTHTATNGCTAEIRKKEPPHPIRVAKTIDVIARITFPVAYFMFLTFFFIHYKGSS
ncbi:PREDICTED: glutamate-gated chloride channel isoform X1 [Polistes dominula]|uniref:Glutamate-gated chloride channel isoform X1 n=1 Tax=Polistes dominula TaxID=743375 RepID=A0ABM1IUZ5_POLDO|nr:PREDICTED: glutamate-gated chloride channel isoform X1 [Polistes dominula]XP_015184004.1 PREDICTED: glutamate-gated chloride channel isoform X1 [Polistes dominula]XP_015184013.1 PREDICTED: glutamate-gated chloride channel isoform X1 [Polistes dominula]XP_015184023.1 PREDICTED: glutamate-gated chloride channel isoform X1 [Polistes dominula]XP_015184032.1 PREDICTED: glutamate-gated chloride channel isoform X1 [Polistes dominula]XP_015184040.1 PREDICTED: glutamate-gated chloride channel isofor